MVYSKEREKLIETISEEGWTLNLMTQILCLKYAQRAEGDNEQIKDIREQCMGE